MHESIKIECNVLNSDQLTWGYQFNFDPNNNYIALKFDLETSYLLHICSDSCHRGKQQNSKDHNMAGENCIKYFVNEYTLMKDILCNSIIKYHQNL